MPVPRHVRAPLRERGVRAEAAGAYAGPAVGAAGGDTWRPAVANQEQVTLGARVGMAPLAGLSQRLEDLRSFCRRCRTEWLRHRCGSLRCCGGPWRSKGRHAQACWLPRMHALVYRNRGLLNTCMHMLSCTLCNRAYSSSRTEERAMPDKQWGKCMES